MYRERDLQFLRTDTLMGREIQQAHIENEMDDDCQTDEELCQTAKHILTGQLFDAINCFVENRPESDKYIANLNL
jgi:hypothetical protein